MAFIQHECLQTPSTPPTPRSPGVISNVRMQPLTPQWTTLLGTMALTVMSATGNILLSSNDQNPTWHRGTNDSSRIRTPAMRSIR